MCMICIQTYINKYTLIYIYINISEGGLEVKLPAIWTDGKAKVGRLREEKRRKMKIREKKVRGKTMQMQVREKVAKWRNTVFFPMICGSGGSKSRLAKAAGAEPSGQMRDKKLHAVVPQSTFRSQKCKKLTVSEHFWKLRCRKSARRCGAKRVSKSKCTNHTRVGALLEVEMSKKCTLLWREAHFQVKMYKTHQVRSTFGRSDVVSRGRRKGLCTSGFPSISKNDGRRLHYTNYTTLITLDTTLITLDTTLITLH